MQSASHDCGFHKLMHAQHWGRAFSVQHSRKEDICNIRMILMHTWLNFEENDSGKASWIWHRYDSFTARPSLANQYSALGISSIFKKNFSIFQEAFFSDQNSILYQNLNSKSIFFVKHANQHSALSISTEFMKHFFHERTSIFCISHAQQWRFFLWTSLSQDRICIPSHD